MSYGDEQAEARRLHHILQGGSSMSIERTIYAVVYGNYDPPEVDGLYTHELDAVERSEALNAEPQSTGMWEVRPMALHESPGASSKEGSA